MIAEVTDVVCSEGLGLDSDVNRGNIQQVP